MIDRKTFFAQVRAQFQPLNQSQVDGFDAILDEWERGKGDDLRQLGYMLGTSWHETGTAMQAIIETRRPGEGPVSEDLAIARLESSWRKGVLTWVKKPYWRRDGRGRTFLGRGLVQLTHEANYRKLGDAIGVDLVANPSLALDLRIAIRIMFVGMERGLFTGRKLGDFFHGATADWFNARRIINGVESAEKVAAHAKAFYICLRAAAAPAKSPERPAGGPAPAPAPSRPATPPSPPAPALARPIPVFPEPAPPRPGFWGRLTAMFGR